MRQESFGTDVELISKHKQTGAGRPGVLIAASAALLLVCGCREPFTNCYDTQTCAIPAQGGEAGLGGAGQGSARGGRGGTADAGSAGNVPVSSGGSAGRGSAGESGGSAGLEAAAGTHTGGQGTVDPACTVTKVAVGTSPMIDDFADGDAAVSANEERNGNSTIAKSPTAVLLPEIVEGFVRPISGGNPDKAVRVAGSDENVGDPTKAWGASATINLVRPRSNTSGECYDARAYSGIKLSMKGKGRVRIDVMNSLVREGKSEPWSAEVELTDNWLAYPFAWKDLRRPSDGAFLADPSSIYAIKITSVLKPPTTKTFDFWVDNVRFMSKPGEWVTPCAQPTVRQSLISDFSTGNAATLPDGRVVAWWFEGYGDKLEIVDGVLHFTSTGQFNGYNEIGTELPSVPCFDVSRYSGIKFRAKSSKQLQLKLELQAFLDPDVAKLAQLIELTSEWAETWVRFEDLRMPDGTKPKFNGAERFRIIEIMSAKPAKDDAIDLFLDDVAFW